MEKSELIPLLRKVLKQEGWSLVETKSKEYLQCRFMTTRRIRITECYDHTFRDTYYLISFEACFMREDVTNVTKIVNFKLEYLSEESILYNEIKEKFLSLRQIKLQNQNAKREAFISDFVQKLREFVNKERS